MRVPVTQVHLAQPSKAFPILNAGGKGQSEQDLNLLISKDLRVTLMAWRESLTPSFSQVSIFGSSVLHLEYCMRDQQVLYVDCGCAVIFSHLSPHITQRHV